MSTIRWPDTLVTELSERRCIVFMGAGVSICSVGSDVVSHPPGWGKFLTGALPLVGGKTDRQFASPDNSRSLGCEKPLVLKTCCQDSV